MHANKLVAANKVDEVIKVVSGKIEEIELPEQVDVIISEPMGYMLLNERMLETFLHAKKFLRPGGKMFPSRGDLHLAPFTDEALYMEQFNKVNFWYQEYFHGVNLSSLRSAALTEYFRQPIVDTFDINICTAKTQRHVIDFQVDLDHLEPSFIKLCPLRLPTRPTCTGLRSPWSSTCSRPAPCTASPSGLTSPSSGRTTPCG